MYITVRLLNGLQRPLTYKIPKHWDTHDVLYSIVQVPLQNRQERGLVIAYDEKKPQASYQIKEALSREPFPDDKLYQKFIQKLAHYYTLEPTYFYKRTKRMLIQKQRELTQTNQEPKEQEHITLTDEQQQALEKINHNFNQTNKKPILLHGVTGSGKTEIYKKVIEYTIAQQKSVLFLVPEVSLAVQFEHIYKNSLHIPIYSFHSATSAQTKQQLWQALLQKQPCLIIGVHLPTLLPIANLGALLIDEEHDAGYQEKKHPKINTKEAALMRAQQYNIPIILGSATPSIASLHATKSNKWDYIQLKKRFNGNFPTLSCVNLTEKKNNRKNFWISQELHHALTQTLQEEKQALIFLNRRGHSFFVQCKECGHIFECKNCSVSLTLHNNKTLRCHYCDFRQPEPTACPQCKKTKMLKKGIGTQQIVTILEKLFPHARIARADLDSTVNKKKWQQTVTDFYDKKIDILVGTQTITKGYHFPHVTLVGVIWADIQLHMPRYHALENTVQQLLQVAGRAGRCAPKSHVIVQTITHHAIEKFLDEQKYSQFFDYEKEFRENLQYPPYARFSEIELRHTDAKMLETAAQVCAQIFKQNKFLKVLGPALPPVHTIKNIHARVIHIKCAQYGPIIAGYKQVSKMLAKTIPDVKIFYTPNPIH